MIHPPVQAVVMALTGLIFMLVGWFLSVTGIASPDRLFPWSVAASFLLFFAVMNSLLSIQSGSFTKYWGSSMYSYMGLALASGLLARAFSGIPFAEAGTYRWIFFVVSFCFLVFLSMINFIKRIVNFAEREEWNQPRRRNR
ncbi:MAG: hypothetical protein IT269_14255 [Saprospiraceae bacterium]|nr:hypothetical protein [Saprospiraceae bacterium]